MSEFANLAHVELSAKLLDETEGLEVARDCTVAEPQKVAAAAGVRRVIVDSDEHPSGEDEDPCLTDIAWLGTLPKTQQQRLVGVLPKTQQQRIVGILKKKRRVTFAPAPIHLGD